MLVRGIYECFGCGESFQLSYEKDSRLVCPSCKSGNISCVREDPIKAETQTGGCSDCGCGHHQQKE